MLRVRSVRPDHLGFVVVRADKSAGRWVSLFVLRIKAHHTAMLTHSIRPAVLLCRPPPTHLSRTNAVGCWRSSARSRSLQPRGARTHSYSHTHARKQHILPRNRAFVVRRAHAPGGESFGERRYLLVGVSARALLVVVAASGSVRVRLRCVVRPQRAASRSTSRSRRQLLLRAARANNGAGASACERPTKTRHPPAPSVPHQPPNTHS